MKPSQGIFLVTFTGIEIISLGAMLIPHSWHLLNQYIKLPFCPCRPFLRAGGVQQDENSFCAKGPWGPKCLTCRLLYRPTPGISWRTRHWAALLSPPLYPPTRSHNRPVESASVWFKKKKKTGPFLMISAPELGSTAPDSGAVWIRASLLPPSSGENNAASRAQCSHCVRLRHTVTWRRHQRRGCRITQADEGEGGVPGDQDMSADHSKKRWPGGGFTGQNKLLRRGRYKLVNGKNKQKHSYGR